MGIKEKKKRNSVQRQSSQFGPIKVGRVVFGGPVVENVQCHYYREQLVQSDLCCTSAWNQWCVFFFSVSVPALQGTLHNYTIIFPSPASLCLTDIAGEIQIQTRQ